MVKLATLRCKKRKGLDRKRLHLRSGFDQMYPGLYERPYLFEKKFHPEMNTNINKKNELDSNYSFIFHISKCASANYA